MLAVRNVQVPVPSLGGCGCRGGGCKSGSGGSGGSGGVNFSGPLAGFLIFVAMPVGVYTVGKWAKEQIENWSDSRGSR